MLSQPGAMTTQNAEPYQHLSVATMHAFPAAQTQTVVILLRDPFAIRAILLPYVCHLVILITSVHIEGLPIVIWRLITVNHVPKILSVRMHIPILHVIQEEYAETVPLTLLAAIQGYVSIINVLFVI